MNSKYKFKIVCGFREDQEYTIDANELHKAFYLFNNPKNNRTTFRSGVALMGEDIRRIVPDYHATMGWNSTHKLDSDDLNELHSAGVFQKLSEIMNQAKEIARIANVNDINTPLLSLVRGKFSQLESGSTFGKQVLANRA